MKESEFDTMNAGEYEVMYRLEKTHWWYKGLRGILFYWTQKYLEGRSIADVKILDAGCGTGMNLSEHEKLGISMWGIDASNDAVAFTKSRGAKNVSKAIIQQLPFENQFFDIIYSMDVITMLPEAEVKKAFVEFRRCMKPGGKLMLNSATLHFLYSSHDVAVHVVSRYSKKTIEALLIDTGFVIEKSTYRYFLLFPLMAVVKLIQKVGLKSKAKEEVKGDLEKTSPLLNSLFYPVMKLENQLLKVINLPIGSSLFIVARLK